MNPLKSYLSIRCTDGHVDSFLYGNTPSLTSLTGYKNQGQMSIITCGGEDIICITFSDGDTLFSVYQILESVLKCYRQTWTIKSIKENCSTQLNCT